VEWQSPVDWLQTDGMYIQSWTHDDADELCVIAESDMISMDDVLRRIRFDDLKNQELTLKLTDLT
jgi:hypothetical protein